ncbi:MAG: CehA/McbA family metallohydrolase [Deltaproteobacteria bacterium]|nr:CehA/McbA family metallohydrolase [Deltaproteobacteria bacterium]
MSSPPREHHPAGRPSDPWPWVLCALLGLAACGDDSTIVEDGTDGDGDGEVDAGPDPLACEPRATPLPLDEVPAAGAAVAGRVTSAAELPGGELVLTQPGFAWKLANRDVVFVIQGNEAHVGYSLYGGSLMDADLQRPGQPGHDTLFEQFPVVGYRLSDAERVEVLCDGNGGRPAVVRVEGNDAPSLLLPQIDALSPNELHFRIVTDYILEPDSRTLRVRTTAINNGVRTWGSLAMGDLLLLGPTNSMWSPERGFGDLTDGGQSLIVTASDPEQPRRNVSYGFATEHGPLTLPIASEGATGAIGWVVHTLPPGGQAAYERRITVGRDASAALEPLLEYLGRPSAVVTGTVTDGTGVPVARAFVAALPADGGPAAGSAVTDEAGSYRLVVAPGSWPLVAAKDGCLRGTGATGTLADADTAEVDLQLGACGELTLAIADADGPVPAKVTLYGLDVEDPERRLEMVRGEHENVGAHRALLTPDGAGTYPVKPGRYNAVVSRGFEYRFVEQELTVPAGGTATLSATLDRVVDTTGWVGGDFHLHTLHSPDGKVTPCERVTNAAAEGLDVAVATDHDGYTSYWPCIDELGLRPRLWTMVGCEVSNMGGGGHRNAYPMPYDEAHVLDHWGPQYWVGLTAQELNDKLHAEATAPVLQMNHPRSTDSYMNWVDYDPVTGEVGRSGIELAGGWEAIETSNGDSFPFDDVTLLTPERAADLQALPRGDVPDFADYLGLTAHGVPLTAMGTSDAHGRNDGTGYARSFVPLGDDPAALTEADVVAAVRAQQVVVSNGAFLRVTAEGLEALGPDQLVPLDGTDVELYVQAETNPEFDLSFLYVFANGRPLYLTRETDGSITAEDSAAGGGTLELALIASDALDDVVRLATEVRHRAAVDTRYNVLVRGIGSMGPLPASSPFAYTNAIYVDVDGGGWSD